MFAPKFRIKEIYGTLKREIGMILRELCRRKEVEVISAETCQDHIHMYVSISPKLSVPSFMGYLKEKSSMMIFKDHANLRYKYKNCNFGATEYYVSTVGLNEATIRKYIRDQEKEDILEIN